MTSASHTPDEAAELAALLEKGRSQVAAGHMSAAEAIFRQILIRWPDTALAYNYLGNLLLLQGKPAAAAVQYQQALALRPDLVEPYNHLGLISRGRGQSAQAVAWFEQALARAPDFAAAHNNLGNALNDLGRTGEAAAEYLRALALQPDLAEAHNNLGGVLRSQGRLDEASEQFRRAIVLKPDYAAAHHNLAKLLKEQGDFAAAAAEYDRALALQPDLVEAHLDRADLKTFRAGDPDLAALESLVAADRLPPKKLAYLHFALGKARDDTGDTRRAFESWRKGNTLWRQQLRYDEAAYLGYLRAIAETFDAALLNRLAGAGDPSTAPIFVLGMPRSGSTLVEQILASHPQVHAAGELWTLDRLIEGLRDANGQPERYPQSFADLAANDLPRLGQAYLGGLPTPPPERTRVVDKMPKNFVYAGLIRLMLPHAKIIHTLRDPVATCLSCYTRLFPVGMAYSYDLGELGRYYRGYHRLMQHWHTALPADALLDVAYERVVDDLEGEARRLIAFCGLPWDERCLTFHETRRPIATPSNVQARQPLYGGSVARWRRYEAYLSPLLAELAPLLARTDTVGK